MRVGRRTLLKLATDQILPLSLQTRVLVHVDMPQSHVVKRGSQFYFRIALVRLPVLCASGLSPMSVCTGFGPGIISGETSAELLSDLPLAVGRENAGA